MLVPCLLLLILLTGCADTRYYWQSVAGHFQLMQAARPIEHWLADSTTPLALQQRLKLAQDMRRFAVTELQLPDNASYHSYADLQRRHAVWNVVAAPEFSLTLKTWCFPVAGCVGYRGYFAEADARAEAQAQRAAGLEASVYGVPAYSTLGWMNWLGGDPLLNTFIHYPEGEVARLLFHELSHQVLYVPDDTVFNESFATAVERLGGALWLAQQAGPPARQAYADFDARRQQFRALTRSTRDKLKQIYTTDGSQASAKQSQAVLKNQAMQDFRAAYAELKTRWGGYSGYDAWVAQANNAAFGAQAAYDELVPGFEALFVREGRHWPAFYDAVRQLAKRSKQARAQQLKQWAAEQHGLPRIARNDDTLSHSRNMAELNIVREHALGLAKARKIAFQWAEQVEQEFSMQCNYAQGKHEDEVDFVRAGVKGSLTVTQTHFELRAQLGFLLGAFKGTIEAEIVKNLDALLAAPAKKQAEKKTR